MEDLYQSLPCVPRESRLVSVTGQQSTSVQCHLEVFDLDAENLDFKALSYCWGNEAAACLITINGHLFYVRPNLYSFLERLRDQQDTTWTFTDAVCINQDNIADKSHQVPLMGDIYRKADNVLVWLGPSPGNELDASTQSERNRLWYLLCDLGQDIVQNANAAVLQSRIVAGAHLIASSAKGNFEITSEVRDTMDLYASALAVLANENGIECLNSWFIVLLDWSSGWIDDYLEMFCLNSYWTRLWVVQEMILARKLMFQRGDFTLDWRALLLFTCLRSVLMAYKRDEHFAYYEDPLAWQDLNDLAIDGFQQNSNSNSLHMDRALDVLYIESHNQIEASSFYVPGLAWRTLAWVLLHRKRQMQYEAKRRKVLPYDAALLFQLQKCTVPHDSVYGYLGMVHSSLEANYEMPIVELRIRALIDLAWSMNRYDAALQARILFTVVPELAQEFGIMLGMYISAICFRRSTMTIANALLATNRETKLTGVLYGVDRRISRMLRLVGVKALGRGTMLGFKLDRTRRTRVS